MQISHIEVVSVEIKLRLPYLSLHHKRLESIPVVFIRIETKSGLVAWGCAAFDPAITGEKYEEVLRTCHDCADRSVDLNPLNTEYALDELSLLTEQTPSVQCAFDMAFHDLLGLASGLPLFRLLGGYRDRILTSMTIGVAPIRETINAARDRARQGFRILKIKGGTDPELDVRRVRAVHDALPHCTLRLDADQGYDVQQSIDVTRALDGILEMLEQPTHAPELSDLSWPTKASLDLHLLW